jgi:peptidoglycan/xylan/chitin deacetylase (PgdA/CDA1 family)
MLVDRMLRPSGSARRRGDPAAAAAARRALRIAAIALAAACSRGKPDVPILGFHAVADDGDRGSVLPATFAAELDALARAGFHTVSFRGWLLHEDRGAPLPEKPILLTFDDGTEDAYSTVLPMLRARGMRGSFFVTTSFVGDDAAHRQVRTEAGTRKRYLVWPELRSLVEADMEVESHGVTHERLPDLDRDRVLAELRGSKAKLESSLGIDVLVFAYPYNSMRGWIEPLVEQAGYRAAVAGMVHGGKDRFALYRTTVNRDTTPEALVAAARASGP